MTEKCKISFNIDKTTFQAGGIMRGSITIGLLKNIQFKDIRIVLNGQVIVEWQDLNSKLKNGFMVYFMQRYFGSQLLVYEYIQPFKETDILSTGNYIYPFEIYIPQDAPHTYISDSVRIQYELNVLLNNMKMKSTPITIHGNIIYKSNLLIPIEQELTKLCRSWWTCKARPVTVSIKIPASIFAPGDIINYILNINNTISNSDIYKISLLLIQTQELRATEPYYKLRKDFRVIKCITYEHSSCSHSSQCSIHGNLQIPNTLMPSSQNDCVFMISYKLKVNIYMSFGFIDNDMLNIPIKIGYAYKESNKLDIDSPCMPPSYEEIKGAENLDSIV